MLSELQARQILQRMHFLRGQIEMFAAHATTLGTSPSLDARTLLQEGDNLLRALKTAQTGFGEYPGSSQEPLPRASLPAAR